MPFWIVGFIDILMILSLKPYNAPRIIYNTCDIGAVTRIFAHILKLLNNEARNETIRLDIYGFDILFIDKIYQPP